METSFRIGPMGAFCPRTMSVRNSMNPATRPGMGPKMKNARSICYLPEVELQVGDHGEVETERLRQRREDDREGAEDGNPGEGHAVEPPELSSLHVHPGTTDFNKNMVATKKVVIFVPEAGAEAAGQRDIRGSPTWAA